MRVPFQAPPGINRDDTDFSKAGWSSGSMVRFWRGQPQTRGGWESVTLDLLGGVCRGHFAWTDNVGELNIAFGTHQTLEVLVGGGLYDITPAGLAAGNIDGTAGSGYGTGTYGSGDYGEPALTDYWPRTWSLGAWGQNLLASPRGGKLYIWENDTGAVATEIANAPDQITWMLVSPKQRQVIVLGCNEVGSGDFNPRCIRMSDVEDYDQWTPSAANLSDEIILGGSGRLVAGRFIGDHIAAWTDSGLYLGVYQGIPAQPWRFDPVAENCGLIGPLAVTVRGGAAYWITPSGQFLTWAVGGSPAIVPSTVRDEVFDNLAAAQQDKIVCSAIGQFGEVEWFYPDARDGNEVSRSVSLSLTHESPVWMTHELPRTSFIDADPAPYPVGVTYAGNIYWHEKGQSADGGQITGHLESADQYLDASESRMLIRFVAPDFRDQQGAVTLSLITRDEPQGVETERGPWALAPTDTRKNFFVHGRLIRMRLEFASTPCHWRLGTPIFDVVKSGKW